jgi:DNA (cytosine-5)-methyltransferase 1
MKIRVLELFCGMGGFAAAVAGSGFEIIGALDHDQDALEIYSLNFPGHIAFKQDLERIEASELAAFSADFWWLSPPCQPYCVRGARRDLDDLRAASLVRIMDILERLPASKLPLHLALENVEGFYRSQARERLVSILSSRGYNILECVICPTELGIPSRRPRYYLAASRIPFRGSPCSQVPRTSTLKDYLTPFPEDGVPESLLVHGRILAKFGDGLRILDPYDPAAYTTCFTSGYGKSVIRAGSYLKCNGGARYFAPEEIARLLHFPDSFLFPEGISLRRRWHFIGNSLSVAAVRVVLGVFSGLPERFVFSI